MDWIFDGIGTAIITLIFGLVFGGAAGYRIGIKKSNRVNQRQKAGSNSSQVQVGKDYNGK
jgi:membrane protein YqaA with SNARE-associated domain